MDGHEPSGLFRDFIDAVSRRVSLHTVILFGSRARGTAGPWSDYDLVVVADFQESFMDRGRWVVQLGPRVPMDVFCYTPGEFERMFASFNLTAIDAIGEGIVLHGEAFIAPYKRRHAEFVRRGMRKLAHALVPPGLA